MVTLQKNHMVAMHDVETVTYMLKVMRCDAIGVSGRVSGLVCTSAVRPEARKEASKEPTLQRHTRCVSVSIFSGSPHHRPHGIGHLSPVCRVHARSQRHSTLYRGRELWRLGLGRAQFFWNRELARSFGVGSSYCCMSVYIPAKLFANFVQVAGLVAQTCAWHLLKELVNP